MRARNIRPGFYKNEDLADCSFAARILYTGLWCLADRNGYLKDRPKRIRAEVFPYETLDVEPLLAELISHGFIIRYEAEGNKYIYIPSFRNNQSPHKNESSFGYPEYDSEKHSNSKEHHTSTIQTPYEHCAGMVQNVMTYDLCNMTDDSPNRENVRDDSNFNEKPTKKKADISQGKVFKEPCSECEVHSKESGKNDKQPDSPIEEWFNKLWEVYPRKDDKKRARKTFIGIFKGIQPEKQKQRMENIILRLTRYVSDRKDQDPKYTKLPTTWLNAYDWDETPGEDECLMTETWQDCSKEGRT